MGTITIEPKDHTEFQLLTSMLKKMKTRMKLNLTEKEREKLLAISTQAKLLITIFLSRLLKK